jgi:hypothetical protein
MPENTEYIQDIGQLKDEAIVDLEGLLNFAKNELFSSANFNHFIKAKTILRYNAFSAMYQRADAVLALTRVNQGNVANIIVRSMWETMADYDFMNLETSNLNIEIRFASESKQQLSTWKDVQRLRAAYPSAETWQATISDSAITRTIARRQAELAKFARMHPGINLNFYQPFLGRLKAIDDSNLAKDPHFKTLTQFDYRSVYSLLSSDTHSTLLGNMNNTQIDPKVKLDIRLDAPLYESVRAAHVAYKFFLKFMQNINRTQRLKKGAKLKTFRAIDKTHDDKYTELQDKYGF